MDNSLIKDHSFEGQIQIEDNINGSANISKQLESEFYQKFIHGQNLVNETDQNIHDIEESHLKGDGSVLVQRTQLIELNRKLEQTEEILLQTENEKQQIEREKNNLFQQNSQLVEKLESASLKQSQIEQLYQNSLDQLKQNKFEEVNEELNLKCSSLQSQVDDQKKQINFKIEEIKQIERVNDQYKQEINSLKKYITKLEDINAEVKAKGQAMQEENNQLKEEQNRQRQQLRHFHQENLQLRKEIDLLNGQKEKFQEQIQDLKLTNRTLQHDNENLQKNDQVIKLKYQLESANQEINRYRAQIQNGANLINSEETESSPIGRVSLNNRTPLRAQPITHQYYSPKAETKQSENRRQRPQDNLLKQNYIRQLEQSQVFRNYNDNQRKISQENEPQMLYRQIIDSQQNVKQNGHYLGNKNDNNCHDPQLTQKFNTLQVGGLHLSNYDHICSIENSLMQLQGKKTELEGQFQKLEQQKLKTQVQITRKRELETQIEKIINQISNLRKDLRSYNALK